jgi:hypothetical protein
VFVVRFGSAFRTWLHRDLIRALQGAGFLEAPMPSLFHVVLPVSETCVTARSVSLPAALVRRVPFPSVADELDTDAMIKRFQARARAVRQRGIPPLEGPERKRFMEQARTDFMDYAMIGDAEAHLEDGVLNLRIDLRPRSDPPQPATAQEG